MSTLRGEDKYSLNLAFMTTFHDGQKECFALSLSVRCVRYHGH